MNDARNEAIIERAAMGWHELDIAADLGLTPSVVHGVLSRWRAAPRRLKQKVRARDLPVKRSAARTVEVVECQAW